MMTDIIKCGGINCRVRGTCHRYTARWQASNGQSWLKYFDMQSFKRSTGCTAKLPIPPDKSPFTSDKERILADFNKSVEQIFGSFRGRK